MKHEIQDNSNIWGNVIDIHIKLIPAKILSGFCSCEAIIDRETESYKIINACKLHQAWKEN